MCKGFVPTASEALRINAFYARFSQKKAKPNFLTLQFLPRINGALLELNGSSVRPDAPAFVTLDPVRTRGPGVYGCRDRVLVCEGTKFEIYFGESKAVKGIFRKDGEGQNWRMDCESVLPDGNDVVLEAVTDADGVVLTEKVAAARLVRRRAVGCRLEEIPEQSEGEGFGTGVCGCSECSGEVQSDGEGFSTEVETDGVRWAVDVGIWVACAGVGFLVSTAASRRLRRKMRPLP